MEELASAAALPTVDSSNGDERGEEDHKNSLATSFMSGTELRRVLERFPDILGEQSDERRDQMCIDDWGLDDPFEGAGDHLKEIEDPLLVKSL